MKAFSTFSFLLAAACFHSATSGIQIPPVQQQEHDHEVRVASGRNVSQELFSSLEELSRIVDITYCVGTTGINKPFRCAGRCREFEGFELVMTWNTGPLLSDSCGFLALSHQPWPKRIIVGFRGTYSITNTIIDLSAVPQAYVPYNEESSPPPGRHCRNCTVHAGFMASWRNARSAMMSQLSDTLDRYPDYQLVLVGHSLGGAVAALAGLEFQIRGWKPQVTTFGEPRIGNKEMASFIDQQFNLTGSPSSTPSVLFLTSNKFQGVSGFGKEQSSSFYRVTHVNDPVPLLPLTDWGYRMHGGEIYISKPDLPPEISDLEMCEGDADPNCIAKAEVEGDQHILSYNYDKDFQNQWNLVPHRFRLWELFFSHRDYFWRLGVCLPGGRGGPGT